MSNLYIPSDLKLTNLQQPNSAVIDRSNLTFFPTGDTTYTSGYSTQSGPYLEFRLPSIPNKAFDMSTFFISFSFKINLTGCSKANNTDVLRCFVHDSIESIFRSVTVYIGSGNVPLETIYEYNALETIMNFYVSDSFVKTMGTVCMGAGLTGTQRMQIYDNQDFTATALATGSTQTRQFTVPLRMCGLANPSLVLPSNLFPQTYATIRIELEAPANCIYAVAETAIAYAATTGIVSGGTPAILTNATTALNYTLSNVRATCDVITYSQEYSSMLNNAVASSKLSIPLKTWDVQARNIPTNSLKFTENLSFNYSSIDAIFIWFVRSGELNLFSKCGKDRPVYPPNLKDISFKINGVNYPLGRPIDLTGGASEAYMNTIVALGEVADAEMIGPNLCVPTIINQCAAGISTNYLSALTSSQTFGDLYYGQNRPETAATTLNGNTTGSAFNNANNYSFGTQPVHTTTSGFFIPCANESSPSKFMIGVNLKKVLREEAGIATGLNLQQGTGLIGYEINWSSASDQAYTMYVAVLHNNIIEISGSSVSVRT